MGSGARVSCVSASCEEFPGLHLQLALVMLLWGCRSCLAHSRYVSVCRHSDSGRQPNPGIAMVPPTSHSCRTQSHWQEGAGHYTARWCREGPRSEWVRLHPVSVRTEARQHHHHDQCLQSRNCIATAVDSSPSPCQRVVIGTCAIGAQSRETRLHKRVAGIGGLDGP